jgi:NADH-quinone oxidoreductase subunit N
MSPAELIVLSPLICAALVGTAVMLAGAFGARLETLHRIAIIGIGASLAAIFAVRPSAPMDVTPLLRVDHFALLFLTLLFSAAGILAIFSRSYLVARGCGGEAYYSLLLFATVGMGILACSTHFASFFLGLETLSVSLYVLLGYLRRDRPSLEAAAKYLILAAMASGFLLFGIALLYAATGTLLLSQAVTQAAAIFAGADSVEAVWVTAGALLLLVGFGFKLALVPFHMWSPDVYQGAPAPVTALIATGSKGAVIAVLLRILAADPSRAPLLASALATLAVVTMFGGNLLALLQTDLKRLLAYSSVAHIGYVFVAVATGGLAGGNAAVFYTVTYVATTLGAFGVIAVLSSNGTSDMDDLDAYRGLGRRRPGLAAALTVMLLSLAGVPPTGGFLAKFAVMSAAVGAGRGDLALAMAAASAIAVFYYLRVLVVMYMNPEQEGETTAPMARDSREPATNTAPFAGAGIALIALVLIVLAIGVYPEPWLRAVETAVASVIGS